MHIATRLESFSWAPDENGTGLAVNLRTAGGFQKKVQLPAPSDASQPRALDCGDGVQVRLQWARQNGIQHLAVSLGQQYFLAVQSTIDTSRWRYRPFETHEGKDKNYFMYN